MQKYSTYLNFLNLITIEIFLNIDNFILIAYLTNQLPRNQRDSIRKIMLVVILTIRVGLIFLISHILNLKKIYFRVGNFYFSSYEILLLIGGSFLLLKVIKELYLSIFKKKSL